MEDAPAPMISTWISSESPFAVASIVWGFPGFDFVSPSLKFVSTKYTGRVVIPCQVPKEEGGRRKERWAR